MRLLLVEDDPVMSTTLARALERRGLRVAAVGDGLAALAHWQRHPPDAVLPLATPIWHAGSGSAARSSRASRSTRSMPR